MRVVTCHPTTEQFILLMVNVLPFSATGKVSGFLQVSMFLWIVFAKEGKKLRPLTRFLAHWRLRDFVVAFMV